MADECPTGRYLSEIVTASGLTPKHPLEDPGSSLGVPHSLWDWSGSEHDYAEWDALAITLIGRLERAWLLLKAWPGTERISVEDYDALVVKLNDVRERYWRMRSAWSSAASAGGSSGWVWGGPIAMPDVAWDASDDVSKMVGIIVDAQCLRQRIDDTLASSGGKPERPGDTGHKAASEGMGIIGTAATVAVGLLVIGGGVYLAKRIGRA